jgi:predicted neutral ceramidase superfamily lipid hydrolase
LSIIFKGMIMSALLRAVRGFLNVTVSGVLLLLATSLLVTITSTPASGFKGGWVGALVTLGAALFSGFLATAFWVQREGRRSYHSSAILNGLSTVAFLSVVVIWWVNY